MEIEYKSEYKTFVNDAILSYLNSYTSDNEEKGFLSLIYYIAKNHRSKIQDIKYYIREAFINYSPNGLDNILKCIFSEMIKDIMDKKFYNTCNVYNNISFRASYTDAKLELFVEHGTYVNYLEAKQFCSELKRLLPDINIFNTINRIIQE
jgi:hypothetical protein